MGAGPIAAFYDRTAHVNLAQSFALPEQLAQICSVAVPDIGSSTHARRRRCQTHRSSAGRLLSERNLAAFIGVQSLGIDMLTRSRFVDRGVGPAISLPIFNGGRLQGQLRGADADYAEAVANYDSTVVQALQDVADAAVSQKALGGQIGEDR
jgi:outer membrane protein TolC